MKNTKILLALLGGAAAGAIIGILFAPAKGSETRQKLADSLDGLAGGIKDKASELKDMVSENISDLKGKVNQTKEKVYDKAEKFASESEAKGTYGSGQL